MLADFQEMDIPSARKKALDYVDYLEESIQPPVLNDELDTPPFLRKQSKSVANKARFSLRSEPRYNEIPTSDSWERFSLEDGIELHVRSDRVKELRSSEIKRILERHKPQSQWFPGVLEDGSRGGRDLIIALATAI